MRFWKDRRGHLIRVGDRVRWNGRVYTIRGFRETSASVRGRIDFEEPLHIEDAVPAADDVVSMEHFYAPGYQANDPCFACTCGHTEPIRENIGEALERMNDHIRTSYTDEEWERKMQRSGLAVFDPTCAQLTLPRGAKS